MLGSTWCQAVSVSISWLTLVVALQNAAACSATWGSLLLSPHSLAGRYLQAKQCSPAAKAAQELGQVTKPHVKRRAVKTPREDKHTETASGWVNSYVLISSRHQRDINSVVKENGRLLCACWQRAQAAPRWKGLHACSVQGTGTAKHEQGPRRYPEAASFHSYRVLATFLV